MRDNRSGGDSSGVSARWPIRARRSIEDGETSAAATAVVPAGETRDGKTIGADSRTRDAGFGATGALQQPLGIDATVLAPGRQHACAAGAGADETGPQQAARPAAKIGAHASSAAMATTIRRRCVMRVPGDNIPAWDGRGKRTPARESPCHNPPMPASWALTPPYFIVFGFLTGVVGFRVGWRIGSRIGLPAAQAALGWVAFLLAWAIVGPVWAAITVGAWAAGTTLASIYTFIGKPEAADQRVLRAAPYRNEMLDWLESGVGPEARPSATLRRHLREAIWYTAAAILTANLASMALGAILLNYMNAYVATLLRAATRTGTVLLFSWNVWSAIRVGAYVAIGAAAASPALRLWGFKSDAGAVRALAVTGAGAAVVDVVLKLSLSKLWGRILSGAILLEAARENRSSDVPLSLHIDP